MKKLLLGAVFFGFTVGAANASSFTVAASTIAAPPGPIGTTTDIVLAGATLGPVNISVPGVNGYNVTFTGAPLNQGVVQNTLANVHAVPVAGAGPVFLTGDFGSSTTPNISASGNYLSTGDVGTIDLHFNTAQQSFSLLWGSVDASNKLEFYNGNTLLFTALGTDPALTTALTQTGGFQGFGGSAYVLVTDTTGAEITDIKASSNIISYEFTGMQVSTTTCALHPNDPGCHHDVPEMDPSSGGAALALILGALGLVAERRKRQAA